jgi:hypothetical protein
MYLSTCCLCDESNNIVGQINFMSSMNEKGNVVRVPDSQWGYSEFKSISVHLLQPSLIRHYAYTRDGASMASLSLAKSLAKSQ